MSELPVIFSIEQARRSGMTDAAIYHAVARRRLVRVRKGMYCTADTWHRSAGSLVARHALEARAAWLSLGRRGWASHYTAALLSGLPVPLGQPDLVTLSQANRSDGRRIYKPGLRLRTATVDPRDIGAEWGMAVLSTARTALDVARTHGFAAGLVLADAALGRALATTDDLSRIATTMVGWNSAAARLVARHASALRESPIESCSYALFVERDLPLPECNRWVVGEGRGGVRSDFVWTAYRLAGEADGQVKYAEPFSEPVSVLVDEKFRQLRIEESGFVVVRWTGAEILYHPDRVIDRIVRQSRIASAMYGVPVLLPGASCARLAS
jgi:hypothetical protein